jgi:glycosyltransferase involved in cell wall biosynthesis
MTKFEILIPTVVTRQEKFAELIAVLAPQLEKYNGDIMGLIYWNNFEAPLGNVRQAMLKAARGQYVAFIDDDDMISDDYCDQIYPLLDGVDHIGMKLKFTSGGQPQRPVYHTIKAKGWYDDDTGFYRKITAKDPIKRELALLGDYSKGDFEKGVSEEEIWAEAVIPYVETEHFIDKEIYHYRHNHLQSVFKRTEPETGEHTKPRLGKYFRFMEKLNA